MATFVFRGQEPKVYRRDFAPAVVAHNGDVIDGIPLTMANAMDPDLEPADTDTRDQRAVIRRGVEEANARDLAATQAAKARR